MNSQIIIYPRVPNFKKGTNTNSIPPRKLPIMSSHLFRHLKGQRGIFQQGFGTNTFTHGRCNCAGCGFNTCHAIGIIGAGMDVP